jgi:hypothetical protein
MKNVTKLIIALFAIVAFSCTLDEVGDRPVIAATDAPVLTAPAQGATYVLTPAKAGEIAERFTWESADFGGAVEVTYSIQMDKKGGDFSAPQTLGSAISANQLAVTVEVMNTAALSLKATPFTASEFLIRVVALTGASTSIVSESTTIVITPYTTDAPTLWMPGGYQAASGYGSDWTPATAPKIASSGFGKTDFEGYVYVNNATAQFKFTPAANWDDEVGEAGATDGVYTGVLKAKPAKNCGLPTAKAAYYLVKADTDPTKLTYTLTETAWGIVGAATPGGWDNSTAMTYDKDTKTWTITVDLKADEMKFRANNAWTINFGDDGADNMLEYGGANIKVSDAGNYTITLNLSTPRKYTYTLKKN